MPQKKKNSRSIGTPTLPVQAWDFSDCPDEQAESCCYYEYARESEPTKKKVTRLRSSGPWKSGLYPGDWMYYEEEWFLTFFESFPEYPEKPWLQIDPARRQERLKRCAVYEGPFQSVGPERIPADEDIPVPYFPNDVGAISLHSVHVVEIDWTASDDAIQRKFKQWLADIRPTKELIWGKRGRVSDRELLKFLGTWRLLRAFDGDWDRAADWVKTHGRGTKWSPFYAEQSGWIRASKNAESMMAHGQMPNPAASLIYKLNLSELNARERARASAFIGQMDRTALRRLKKMDAQEALETVLAQVRERHGIETPKASD